MCASVWGSLTFFGNPKNGLPSLIAIFMLFILSLRINSADRIAGFPLKGGKANPQRSNRIIRQ